MGHHDEAATQVRDRGEAQALTPVAVPSRYTAFQHWKPIVSKVAAFALGGVALAVIGAVSMAHTERPSVLQDLHAAIAQAGIAPGTEWLAPGPASPSVSAPATTLARVSLHSNLGGGANPPQAVAPARHESETPEPELKPEPTERAPVSGVLADGRVVLNAANVAELVTLPGIGQKRAEQIVALRTRLGRFRKVSDLLRVKGIGVKSLRKLTPHLVLDRPEAEGR